MKAAVLRAHDAPYGIEEVTGALEASEVLVRIVGVGMCHTDMLLRSPAMAEALAPAILGHEGAGVVEAVGAAVTRATRRPRADQLRLPVAGARRACAGNRVLHPVHGAQRQRSTGRRHDECDGGRRRGDRESVVRAVVVRRSTRSPPSATSWWSTGSCRSSCWARSGAGCRPAGAVLNEMRLAAGQSIAIFGAGAVGMAAHGGELRGRDRRGRPAPARSELALELGDARRAR